MRNPGETHDQIKFGEDSCSKKTAFCQFITEICDKILRPLIQRPLKSEETETCQMLLDNGGIIWMPEKFLKCQIQMAIDHYAAMLISR